MPLSLNNNALTQLDTVKGYLDIELTDTTKDDLLTRLINTASTFIENHCKRKFGKTSYDEKYSGDNSLYLSLKQYPITAVTSVIISDIAETEYEILPDEGMLFREGCWTRGARNIQVQYTAGYVLPKDATEEEPRNLPDDLEQACIVMVMYYYKTDVANFSTVFAESGAVFRPTAMPPVARTLLDGYRRFSL